MYHLGVNSGSGVNLIFQCEGNIIGQHDEQVGSDTVFMDRPGMNSQACVWGQKTISTQQNVVKLTDIEHDKDKTNDQPF